MKWDVFMNFTQLVCNSQSVWGKITPMKWAVFIKLYPMSKARMSLSKILPQTSKKFTQIYLPYLWHYATLADQWQKQLKMIGAGPKTFWCLLSSTILTKAVEDDWTWSQNVLMFALFHQPPAAHLDLPLPPLIGGVCGGWGGGGVYPLAKLDNFKTNGKKIFRKRSAEKSVHSDAGRSHNSYILFH